MRHRTVRGTLMKEEISWGSPVTKLEAFRCQKPSRSRERRMGCMPWHKGCASLEQASTNGSQLQVTRDREPQHPGQGVCWASQAWWPAAWCSCSPRSADQPCPDERAVHPVPCHPVSGAAPQWPRSLGLAGTSRPRSLHLLGKCTLPLAGSGPP